MFHFDPLFSFGMLHHVIIFSIGVVLGYIAKRQFGVFVKEK